MPEGQLTPAEAAHAQSILDVNPLLAPIPPAILPRVLIGSVVRKVPPIVQALLKTLAWQTTRSPVIVDYAFITDFAPTDQGVPEVQQLLASFRDQNPQRVWIGQAGNPGGDFGDAGGTHQWTASAWHRVGALKNQLIQRALDGQYDYLWLIDADVLCDPGTLQSLLDCQQPIVAGVYWTHWSYDQRVDTTLSIHAGPQVWLRHPYQLEGRGYSAAEFRAALIGRDLIQVGGLGACTLFTAHALRKGVHFTPIPEGLPPGPMSDGEDRHLCERARRLHLPLYADAWPDIWHCYHHQEVADIDLWLHRLSPPLATGSPELGDLVSVRLELLEPVPNSGNPNIIQQLPAQTFRGRLGTGHLMPELEEALATMTRGERQIVTLHYPLHHPYATLRLQQRILAVTLLDHKSYRTPPVVEREMFVGKRTGAWLDTTSLAVPQLVDLLDTDAVPA